LGETGDNARQEVSRRPSRRRMGHAWGRGSAGRGASTPGRCRERSTSTPWC